MTIEQQFEKYKDKKHLLGLLPMSAYVRIMLHGMALQEEMERTLKELSVTKGSKSHYAKQAPRRDEGKANGQGTPTELSIVRQKGSAALREAS